jgi:hypothetical protein
MKRTRQFACSAGVHRAWPVVQPLVLLGTWLVATSVHAYRNPDRFKDDVTEGGGGDKYFTGSRAEGYTCEVCHTAGEQPPLQITGVPIGGYESGHIYHITIDWPDDLPSVALNLEMTDVSGAKLGELRAPAATSLSRDDLCTADGLEATSGVTPVDTESGRRIVTVTECGQHQTSVDWLAPAPAAGQFAPQGWFTGSLVVSNRNNKVSGDGVANLSHVLGAAGAPAPLASELTGNNCGVLTPRATDSAPSVWLLLGFAVVCLREHKRCIRRRR